MLKKSFLLVAVCGLMLAGGCQNPPAVPAGPFTLVGAVTIINDCDRQAVSIPNNITVNATLQNANGSVGVPGSANIALNPDAGANPPSKSGTYSITVQWPGGPAGAADNWTNFTETLVGGGNICGSIKCERNTCTNVATRVRTAPVTKPNTTNDIRIRCSCT